MAGWVRSFVLKGQWSQDSLWTLYKKEVDTKGR